MEYWNNGMVEYWEIMAPSVFPNVPIFQYSNLPVFEALPR
jgi:hypothetical protein